MYGPTTSVFSSQFTYKSYPFLFSGTCLLLVPLFSRFIRSVFSHLLSLSVLLVLLVIEACSTVFLAVNLVGCCLTAQLGGAKRMPSL